MNQLANDVQTKLLYVSKNYFGNGNNIVAKIINEPYSYQISKTKMYVFDQNNLFNFLIWYWHNQKETFLFDLSEIYKKQWKYFYDNDVDGVFKNLYPDANTFNSNVIENVNIVQIYDNLIAVNGINNFINELVIINYKSMDIQKYSNTYYKFATNCGIQIIL